MSRSILVKSIVRPFYQRHAGLFVMLFVVMFGVVSILHGGKFTDYHFYLIKGILKNPFFFLLVLLLWLIYIKKTEQFIIRIFRSPEFLFLQVLALLETKKLYQLLAWIQFLLLLPIIFYVLIIFAAGIYMHAYAGCLFIGLYLLFMILICVRWYIYSIQNPNNLTKINAGFTLNIKFSPYWIFFIRYIAQEKKMLYAAIKIYSCSILYEMIVNQIGVVYDLRMILVFFSFGLLGHGLLIFQLRDMEETRLTFYKTLPRSLLNRFIQYALIYFILLLPEFFTLVFLTPAYLRISDCVIFVAFSFSLLVFLNSLLFIQFFKAKDYLKIVLCLFFLIYFCVIGKIVPWLCAALLISSLLIFFSCYYGFERKNLLSNEFSS